ncbi:hypothetical protein [Streptomyces collinus]|uniref:hypothetical protein n=1 Tax=Streptomyces collinus TaxID=42684 RepID=UPI00379FDBAD
MEASAAHGYRVVALDQRGYSPGAHPPAARGHRISLPVETWSRSQRNGAGRHSTFGHDRDRSSGGPPRVAVPRGLVSARSTKRSWGPTSSSPACSA